MGDEDAVRLTPAEWGVAYRTHSLPELIERVNATNLAAGVHGPVKDNGFAGRLYVRLVLPHSGIRTIVPLIAYHNAVLPGTFEGRGVQPDFDVPQSLENSLAGKDTVLEFTLQLIRARRAP